MEKLAIIGGKRLTGEVEISGMKNSAVAVIPASVLVDGVCTIDNLPNIKDVEVILDILQELGAVVVRLSPNKVQIDGRTLQSKQPSFELAGKMRASYYLVGALLGRFHESCVPMPGGCHFGARPIDQHIKGFRSLGASVEIHNGVVEAKAENLFGNNIYLDVVSVGATLNVMFAAVLASGITRIENAAKEPHVVDVANFLNCMGADIKGAGTDVIRINGVEKLTGGDYTIIPDQIEAGTFMIAAAATGGDVMIKNVIPRHLEPLSAKLAECGVEIDEYDDSIHVRANFKLTGTNIKTLPYPGFPTDLQPQIVALLSICEGVSVVTESVYDNRFQYIDEIKKMGANIKTDGHSAIIQGVNRLTGAPVKVTDLRAGAALAIAGLVAQGKTELSNIGPIDRGYYNFEEKLKGLGAQIARIETAEAESKSIPTLAN